MSLRNLHRPASRAQAARVGLVADPGPSQEGPVNSALAAFRANRLAARIANKRYQIARTEELLEAQLDTLYKLIAKQAKEPRLFEGAPHQAPEVPS